MAPSKMTARELYDMMLVIADVISAHCPGTTARERFFRASLTDDWEEVRCLIDGMLAEPWHLRGNQEQRLQEFLDLVPVGSAPIHWVALCTGGCGSAFQVEGDR